MVYKCPYCHVSCYDDGTISKRIYESYEHSGVTQIQDDDSGLIIVELSKCPNCARVSYSFSASYKNTKEDFEFSYPPPNAIELPHYIPKAICSDYLEALSIVTASPKASATLARRCLQGMIHDFWGIKEKTLNAEITSLKGKVSDAQWKAIDGLRKIGNIGAHMEKDVELIVDVDPGEAKKLLKLIELLVEKWYIARHDEEQLLSEISNLADKKDSERHSGTSSK